MEKIKLYLDTSVVSHLFADDVPEKMADTQKVWNNDFVAGKFDLYISPIVLDEVELCKEPKRGELLKEMERARVHSLPRSEEVDNLALEYIKAGVLREKSLADCLHIAHAVVHGCDAIVSWNFKHLVNYKTMNGVKIVNSTNKYKGISIISPAMLIDEGDEK